MTTDNGISLPDAAADLARRERIDARDMAGERIQRGLPLSAEWLATERKLAEKSSNAYHEQKDLGDLLYKLIRLRDFAREHERFSCMLDWLQVQVDHWQPVKVEADKRCEAAQAELFSFVMGGGK